MITVESSTASGAEPKPVRTPDLYKALFTQSPQPFALHTVTVSLAGKPLDCVCVDANAAFQTVLGVSKDKLIGGRIHELSPQMPAASLFPVIEDVLFDQEPDHLTVLSPGNSRYYDVAVSLVAPGIVATVLSELIGIRGAEPPRHSTTASVGATEPAPSETSPVQIPSERYDSDPGSADAGVRRWQSPTAPDQKIHSGADGAEDSSDQTWSAAVESLMTGISNQRAEAAAQFAQPDAPAALERSAASPRPIANPNPLALAGYPTTLGGGPTYLAGERRSASSAFSAGSDSEFDESFGEIHQALMAAAMETYVPEPANSTAIAVPAGQQLMVVDERTPRLAAAPDLADVLPVDDDLWQLVLKSSGEGIWIWNLATSRVLFSNRWRQMLGYSSADVRDQFGHYARLVHPNDLPTLLQKIQSYVSRQSSSLESEHRIRCYDGKYRWVSGRAAALWDDTGAASKIVVFESDIDARKEVDLRLAKIQSLSASLRSVRHAAAHAQEKDRLLQVACTALVEHSLVRRAWVGEYDDVTGVVAPVARDGVDMVDLGTVRVPKAGDPFRNGPTAVAVASRESHVANDLSQIEVQFPWAQQAAQVGYGSVGAFPILVGDRIYGALTVYADESEFFGVDEVTLFEEIASLVGSAMYGIEQRELRSRAETELQRVSYRDPLTGLYNRQYFEEEVRRLQGSRLYPITIVSTDLDGMKVVNDVMGNRAGDQLLTAYANVLKASFRSSDVVARVGGDEFAIILPKTDAEAAQGLLARVLERMNAHNLEGRTLPLSHSVGVATAEEPFDSLEILCRQADNTMFIDRNRRAPARGRNLVRVLKTALRKKDFGGDGHVARVKAMATTLGEAVGVSSKDMTDLELLSEIHDLGKIGVPDRVLLKPGPLDHEEREQIKQHSALGFRIAKISPELEHVAELILYHQEWWNGAGYPTGIGGKEIPVSCRILAIVDAYDAMTSPRPHRPALTHVEAVEELRRGAGRQFDPGMVETFLQITEGS